MAILSTILAVNFDEKRYDKVRTDAREMYLDPHNYYVVYSTRHDDGSLSMTFMLSNGQVVSTKHDDAQIVSENAHLLCDNQFALLSQTPMWEVDCIHNTHVPESEFDALVHGYIDGIRENFHK